MSDVVSFRAAYPPPGTFPPPAAANHFRCSRVGKDVQLLIGYIDVSAAAEAIERARSEHSSEAVDGEGIAGEIQVEVTHRFFMGSAALEELRDKVNEIYDAMVKSGDIGLESRGGSDSVPGRG